MSMFTAVLNVQVKKIEGSYGVSQLKSPVIQFASHIQGDLPLTT